MKRIHMIRKSLELSRFLTRPRLRRALPWVAMLLASQFGAGVAGEKPFTPAADMKGDWSVTADPALPMKISETLGKN